VIFVILVVIVATIAMLVQDSIEVVQFDYFLLSIIA
jgi:hypothetical protein